MNRTLAAYLSTCIAGWIPFAPGTWGSALGLALGYIIVDRLGWLEMFIAFLIITFIGAWAADLHGRALGQDDASEITVDEVSGQWLTLLTPILLLHLGSWLQSGSLHVIALEHDWVAIYFGLAFILFRIFDILKPWPISLADRKLKGGVGVIFDDILAGAAAGVLLYVIYIVGPIFLGEHTTTF